ncbi:MAG: LacI family transcriptional regulator [Acholeplasmataceae bacterium]|jgi:LacI family transcriptional regulator|nr:LacI family transcriptional regulator [Acholeplasmataceae bacterium]
MKSQVKMSDIAKVLGVSTVTVSKALGDKDGVSVELRQKIKAKAQEMGYKISSASQTMRTGRHNNIGILISNRYLEGNSYYWSLYQDLLKELSEKEYFGILEIVSSQNEKQLMVPRIINESKVDAIIIIGQLRKRYLNKITEEAMGKIIFLDFYDLYLPVSCIVSDNFNGGYTVTKYLIDQGHQDLVFVGDVHATTSIMDRAMGFYKCMLDFKKDIRKEWYITDRNEEGFIVDPILPEVLPTAFVCNNDNTAKRLYRVLKEKGYKVPEDISLVGYDNFSTENADIEITTMEVGHERLAKSAVQMIINVINGTGLPELVNLNSKLLEKKSVKKIN